MYKTKDIKSKELNTLDIKNQAEILQHTGSKLDLVKAWEVIKNVSDNFTKSDEKAQEADTLLYQILHPKQGKVSGEIYTMSDGFQWELLPKSEAIKRFKTGESIYRIDRDSETEGLIESEEDFEDFEEFGIEYSKKQEVIEPKSTNSKKQKLSSSEETLKIQEKERARALALLELELLIAA